jgi:hypothetical protein
MRGVFYPIRMQLDFMIGVHESGHAACLLHLAGPGVVDRVTTQGIWYVKPRNDFDRLIVYAGGIAAARFFGLAERDGGIADIENAQKIWEKMPGGVSEWRRALDRAADIVYQRRDFIAELGKELELKQEILAARVDTLWREHYGDETRYETRRAAR